MLWPMPCRVSSSNSAPPLKKGAKVWNLVVCWRYTCLGNLPKPHNWTLCFQFSRGGAPIWSRQHCTSKSPCVQCAYWSGCQLCPSDDDTCHGIVQHHTVTQMKTFHLALKPSQSSLICVQELVAQIVIGWSIIYRSPQSTSANTLPHTSSYSSNFSQVQNWRMKLLAGIWWNFTITFVTPAANKERADC